MSEEIDQKVKMFTPTMPDRDALIFAAGRASAKPSSFWKLMSAGLLLTQLALIFWFVLPAQARKIESPSNYTTYESESSAEPIQTQDEPYSYMALMHKNDLETQIAQPLLPFNDRPHKPLTAGMLGDLLQ